MPLMAGKPDAACDGSNQIGRLLLGDLRHGADRHDQAEIVQSGIGKGLGRVRKRD